MPPNSYRTPDTTNPSDGQHHLPQTPLSFGPRRLIPDLSPVLNTINILYAHFEAVKDAQLHSASEEEMESLYDQFDLRGMTRDEVEAMNAIAPKGQRLEDVVSDGEVVLKNEPATRPAARKPKDKGENSLLSHEPASGGKTKHETKDKSSATRQANPAKDEERASTQNPNTSGQHLAPKRERFSVTDEAASVTAAAEATSSTSTALRKHPPKKLSTGAKAKRENFAVQPTTNSESPPPSTPSPKQRFAPSQTKSPYFPSPLQKTPTKRPAKNISCIPFPPLSTPTFGLAQEKLARTPFHLLLACVFLTKTRGSVSMPVFYHLIAAYPTPLSLSQAKHEDVVVYFQKLGLQNQRAKRVVEMARRWCEDEPRRGRRWRRVGYPEKGDGSDVKPNECLRDEDDEGEGGNWKEERVGWEIAHLPGVGAYGLDSWRIFCRDELRGVGPQQGEKKTHGNGEQGDGETEFEPEWKRALPLDKELRAYLRWRWFKEGWVWDPISGHKRKATEKELSNADHGGVIVEGDEGDKVEAGVEKEGLLEKAGMPMDKSKRKRKKKDELG